MVAFSTVVFLAATATSFALRSEASLAPTRRVEPVERAEPREPEGPGSPENAPRFAADWWQEGATCPPDSRLYGGAPPDGFEVWCARPDGQRHGFNVGWHRNGRQAFVREYRDGVASGVALDWWSSGHQSRAGTYAGGVRQGQWRRWRSDGELAEVIDYDSAGQLVAD